MESAEGAPQLHPSSTNEPPGPQDYPTLPWMTFAGTLHPYQLYPHYENGVPKYAVRRDADHLPPPADPFRPQIGEALALRPMGTTKGRSPYFEHQIHGGYDPHGRPVVIKAVRSHTTEVEILTYLAGQRRYQPDERDHTIPILDIIRGEEWTFVIMPEWSYDWCPYNVKEYLQWLLQCLEGLTWYHSHGIALRDISLENMLRNWSKGYNVPRGVPFAGGLDLRYAFIDFGESTWFSATDVGQDERMVTGTAHTYGVGAPELSEVVRYDPFKVDIYALGRSVQNHMEMFEPVSPVPKVVCHVLPAFVDLLHAMTAKSPSDRPSASEAHSRLNDLCNTTPESTLLAPGCDWFPHNKDFR